jgi:hypothetical protein
MQRATKCQPRHLAPYTNQWRYIARLLEAQATYALAMSALFWGDACMKFVHQFPDIDHSNVCPCCLCQSFHLQPNKECPKHNKDVVLGKEVN